MCANWSASAPMKRRLVNTHVHHAATYPSHRAGMKASPEGWKEQVRELPFALSDSASSRST